MALVISLKSEQIFVSAIAAMNLLVCKESTVHYVLDITRIIKMSVCITEICRTCCSALANILSKKGHSSSLSECIIVPYEAYTYACLGIAVTYAVQFQSALSVWLHVVCVLCCLLYLSDNCRMIRFHLSPVS